MAIEKGSTEDRLLNELYPSMAEGHQEYQNEARHLTGEDILQMRLKAFDQRAAKSGKPEGLIHACRDELEKRIKKQTDGDLYLGGAQDSLASDMERDFDGLMAQAEMRAHPELADVYPSMDEPPLFD